MRILGIDIGYHNMGLVQADWDFKEVDVVFIDKVDITHYAGTCGTREVADLVKEFVKSYKDLFDTSDMVYIERQPPGGLTNVEALLVYMFREKISIISPNTMHKFFNIGHLAYEYRKQCTEEIARPYLEHLPLWRSLLRRHDVADALCLILSKLPQPPKPPPVRLPFDEYRFRATD